MNAKLNWSDAWIAVGFFVLMMGVLQLSYWLGKRVSRGEKESNDQYFNLQGAMLGILGLLLGFSFALVAGKLSDRTALITQEANAISTVWTRCDLMPEVERGEMRPLVQAYLDARIASYDASSEQEWRKAVDASTALQAKMWEVMVRAVRLQPAQTQPLVNPLDEMFDLHGLRVASKAHHLPAMLVILLWISSVVSMGAVGYGSGITGRRNVVLTTLFAFLVSGVLWAIVDMDHPRRGFIQAGQGPMLELRESLK